MENQKLSRKEPREHIIESQELLTIEEQAQRLKVKSSWLYSRTRIKGPDAMPGVIRCGKYLRFSPDIVLNWIKQKYGENR